MRLLLLVALSALTAGCASTAPEAPAPATPAQTQTQTPAANDLSIYTGTYALQAPDRVVDLRVWLDEAGSLTGQLVGLSNPTTLRPDTGHRFLHATRDDIWFLFTVENGRATRVTFNMPGRGEMSGARKP